jgi:hypothetical protein
MDRRTIIIGALSIAVLPTTLFATQCSPSNRLLQRKGRSEPSPLLEQRHGSANPARESEMEQASLQSQAVPLTHLKIDEAERQTQGSVKEEDAIPAQERVFCDSESWHAFWAKYSKDEPPEVDFKTHQVAAVFLGAKPNSGYGVEIDRVTYDPKKKQTVIHVIELLPDPKMGYAAVIVYPSDLVVFPAHPGNVRFARDQKIGTKNRSRRSIEGEQRHNAKGRKGE